LKYLVDLSKGVSLNQYKTLNLEKLVINLINFIFVEIVDKGAIIFQLII